MRKRWTTERERLETEVQPICRSQKLIFNLHPTFDARRLSKPDPWPQGVFQINLKFNFETRPRMFFQFFIWPRILRAAEKHKLVFYRPLTKRTFFIAGNFLSIFCISFKRTIKQANVNASCFFFF